MNIDELTKSEFDHAVRPEKLFILPLGALEDQGPALPLSSGSFNTVHLAKQLAVRLNAMLLPLIPYGAAEGRGSLPGLLSICTETYTSMLTDILADLVAIGAKHLLILTGQAIGTHKRAITDAMARIEEQYDINVMMFSDYELATEAMRSSSTGDESYRVDIESSRLLVSRPELMAGTPRYASDEWGRHLNEKIVTRLVEYVEQEMEGARRKPKVVFSDPVQRDPGSYSPETYFQNQRDLGIYNIWDATEEGNVNRPLVKPHSGKIDCYLAKSAFHTMLRHIVLNRRYEVMGLLVGPKADVFGKQGCVVYDAIHPETEQRDTQATVSVRFRKEAFQEMFERLHELPYEYLIMGWYHSHPGHTAYYSPTDVETHRTLFSQPHQVGIVVDAWHEDMGVFQPCEGGYSMRSWMIVDDSELTEEKFGT